MQHSLDHEPRIARLPARLPWTRLSAQVWLRRMGWWMPLTLLVLLSSALLVAFHIAPARERVATLNAELANLRARLAGAPAAPVPAVATAPGDALRTLLAQADPPPAQMHRIADIARQRGIRLPRGQYAPVRQQPSGLEHTDVTLNFVATYPRARSFVEAVLRDLPNASVDRISFGRDDVQGNEAAINLRLSLWRLPAPGGFGTAR